MSEPVFKHVICPVVVLKITETSVKGDELADGLRAEFLAVATQSEAVHIIIDMQNVSFIASTGIRPFLSLNRYLKDNHRRMILCNLHKDVREVLEVTKLLSTSGTLPVGFEAQPDVPTAISVVYKGA
jgi:anti-anti-sigma factor